MPSRKAKLLLVASVFLLTSVAAAVVTQLHRAPAGTPEAVVTTDSGEWFCPMHPHVRSDHEGNCPICGMKLVNKTGSHDDSHTDQFHVAPQAQERIGVVVEAVEPIDFRPAIDVAAQVVADERGAITLSPKADGWIDRLGVSVPGQRIHAGQMLYEIHSPELQRRQKEYVDLLARRDALLAAKGGEKQDGGEEASAGNSPQDLMLASVAQTRSRLIAADVPAAVLDDLERFRRIHDMVPVLAAHDGVVTGIGAREGAYVRPGEVIVSYADPHAAWAELSLNPEILAQLTNGGEVELRSTVNSETSVSSPIDSSLAVVDPVSRTARLRVPLHAAGDSFLPGALLEAHIRMKARRALTVPSDAILRTGRGNFVIVAQGNNHFRQAPVRIGMDSDDRVEVLEGLSAGERVVTNGQFMLSAESSLQSSWRRLAASHDHPAH